MPLPPDQDCASCLYWHRKYADGHVGECHRFPPTTMPPVHQRNAQAERPEHYFPVTLASQWCGEWKA